MYAQRLYLQTTCWCNVSPDIAVSYQSVIKMCFIIAIISMSAVMLYDLPYI